jgi:mRNA interferase MazF
VIARGGLYWADLGKPVGSRPAKRRPVLVVQAKHYNDSRIATVVVAVVTSNTSLAAMPGNVFLPAASTGLPRDSVVNVTALATVDKSDLEGPVARLSAALTRDVDKGLQGMLGL